MRLFVDFNRGRAPPVLSEVFERGAEVVSDPKLTESVDTFEFAVDEAAVRDQTTTLSLDAAALVEEQKPDWMRNIQELIRVGGGK